MRTLMMTTSILLLGATSALAANETTTGAMLSETERAEVHSMLPGADLSNLTADQVSAIQLVLFSGSDSDSGQHIRAILQGDSMAQAMLTETEKAEVMAMLPGAELGDLTPAQAVGIRAALYSGSDGEQGQQIRAILEDSSVEDVALSSAEKGMVKNLLPTADLSGLSDQQVVAIQLALYSGSDSERGQHIRAILQ